MVWWSCLAAGAAAWRKEMELWSKWPRRRIPQLSRSLPKHRSCSGVPTRLVLSSFTRERSTTQALREASSFLLRACQYFLFVIVFSKAAVVKLWVPQPWTPVDARVAPRKRGWRGDRVQESVPGAVTGCEKIGRKRSNYSQGARA